MRAIFCSVTRSLRVLDTAIAEWFDEWSNGRWTLDEDAGAPLRDQFPSLSTAPSEYAYKTNGFYRSTMLLECFRKYALSHNRVGFANVSEKKMYEAFSRLAMHPPPVMRAKNLGGRVRGYEMLYQPLPPSPAQSD